MRAIIIFFTGSLLFISCNTKVRVIPGSEKPKAKLVIGFIENRNSSYQPFVVQNFIDMLSFELRKEKNEVLVLTSERKSAQEANFKPQADSHNKDSQKMEGAKNRASENANIKGDSDELLEKIIIENLVRKERARKSLSSQQIKKYLEKKDYDYFVQGSISQSESGSLLDTTENSMLFLNFYDKNGKVSLSVNHFLRDKNFNDGKELSKICGEIAHSLVLHHKKIKKIN